MSSQTAPFDNTAPTLRQTSALKEAIGEFKAPVRCVATTNQPLASTGLDDVIDGVTLKQGDRILLTGQTVPAENGIYEASDIGSGRAADANSAAEMTPGFLVEVNEGTSHKGSRWKHTTSGTITLESTALTFAKVTETAPGTASNARTAAFDNTPPS